MLAETEYHWTKQNAIPAEHLFVDSIEWAGYTYIEEQNGIPTGCDDMTYVENHFEIVCDPDYFATNETDTWIRGTVCTWYGAFAHPCYPFTFQFTLSPRDRGEAVQVQKIIRALKQSSATQKTQGDVFLAAPNTYGLQFFKGPTPHKFLPILKECALLNVGVNYMPDNSYMTYEDSSMVSYSLTLSFQELVPIFNSDYSLLDNDSDDILGF